jgi:hypothetical protein
MTTLLADFLDIQRIEEAPILSSEDCTVIGWHSSVFDKNGISGGGLHTNKKTARRIATAEAAERKYFKLLANSDQGADFYIPEFPTSCGFAAGFESENTRFRAIAEGVERWAWSKWIDEHFYIPKVEVLSSELTPLSKEFSSNFDKVSYYKITIDASHIPDFFQNVTLGIAICEKDGGIFPGSRVSTTGDDPWQHAILEAWRHLKIFNQYKSIAELKSPFDRIVYFGKNAAEAYNQINCAMKPCWEKPKILIIKEFRPTIELFKMWRCLIDGYVGWHSGRKDRFVY